MAKPKTAPAAPSFDALLGASTVTEAPKKGKKDSVPKINLTPELYDFLKKFLYHKEQEKAHKGDKEANEKPVLEFCLARYEADALSGNFSHSYEIPLEAGKSVKFVTTDKFSVTQDQLNKIKAITGIKFDELFEVVPEVTLKEEVYTDEVLKKEIAALLGANFPKFFQTTMTLKTKSGFNEAMWKLGRENVIELKKFAVQNKPFIK